MGKEARFGLLGWGGSSLGIHKKSWDVGLGQNPSRGLS